MKLRYLLALTMAAGLVRTAAAVETSQPAAPVHPIFGPYEALVYDSSMLDGVKVDGAGNIFLMFKPERRNAVVRIRISDRDGAAYRKWFNGQDVLVAQENGVRPPHKWTDRVQTKANYIEYWDGSHLFLHLKRIKPEP